MIHRAIVSKLPFALSLCVFFCNGAATAEPAPKQGTLAVAGIVDRTEDFHDKELEALDEFLLARVNQTGKVRVVDQTRLAEKREGIVAEQRRRSFQANVDKKERIRLGRAAQAKKILVTSITSLGSRYVLHGEIIDLETEEVIKGKQTECKAKPKSDLHTRLTMEIERLVNRLFDLKFGELLITVSPSKSRIVLHRPDGTQSTQVGTYTCVSAPPGSWIAEVSTKGHAAEEHQFMVVQGKPTTLNIQLKKFASLHVTGNQEGTRVHVIGPDGKQWNDTLPWSIESLKPGQYQIRATAEDCDPIEQSISLTSGDNRRVKLRLEHNNTSQKYIEKKLDSSRTSKQLEAIALVREEKARWALPRLCELCQSNNPRVRERALRTLLALNRSKTDHKQALDCYTAHILDTDSNTQILALQGLKEALPEGSSSLLIPLMVNPSAKIRMATLEVFAKVDPDGARKYLKAALYDLNGSVRQKAQQLLDELQH